MLWNKGVISLLRELPSFQIDSACQSLQIWGLNLPHASVRALFCLLMLVTPWAFSSTPAPKEVCKSCSTVYFKDKSTKSTSSISEGGGLNHLLGCSLLKTESERCWTVIRPADKNIVNICFVRQRDLHHQLPSFFACNKAHGAKCEWT